VDDAHDGSYAREPQFEDLVRLARALNAHHLRYVLIGGFAVIAHGGARTTKGIDLLIDAAPENVARVREALQILEDKAVNDVADGDVSRYSVVRVADEIVVDLMAKRRLCRCQSRCGRDDVWRRPGRRRQPTHAHPDQEHHPPIRCGRPPVPASADRRSGALTSVASFHAMTACRLRGSRR
jgi:hypothetical protein